MTEEPQDNEMLRDLQRRTAQLPREIAPPDEAWKKIKSQIDMEARLIATMPMQHQERAWWQRPAFLAAAGLMLVAGASLLTALVIGRRVISNATPPVATAPAPSQSGTMATLAEFTARENDYINTANQLATVIESGRVELAPGTIVKLKESLRVIDAAILEARQALAADPANKTLIEILSSSYNQKVDLLRRTAEMGQS